MIKLILVNYSCSKNATIKCFLALEVSFFDVKFRLNNHVYLCYFWIIGKDQSYKIKKVISKDGNAIVDEEEYQEMEKSSTTLSSSRRYKKGATVGLDDYDSDEDAGSKSKKRNAIVDYKKTITNIGKSIVFNLNKKKLSFNQFKCNTRK